MSHNNLPSEREGNKHLWEELNVKVDGNMFLSVHRTSSYIIPQALSVAILVMFLSNYLRCQSIKRKIKMQNYVLQNKGILKIREFFFFFTKMAICFPIFKFLNLWKHYRICNPFMFQWQLQGSYYILGRIAVLELR